MKFPTPVLILACWTASILSFPVPRGARAQEAPQAPAAAPGTPGTEAPPAKPVFKPEELDQIVAPIALYPDSLLSQVLMASTYPLEVVQANRWLKANSKLKGDALTAALEKMDWEPSVKSLVNFPQVLTMMDEKLDWTQKLGDAMLAQQKDLMDAVQRLRAKAQQTGNLKDTQEQKVTVEPSTQTIVIQSSKPEVVYVPTYNPTVVYGTWPPAYPPYYYYPPGYTAMTAAVSFTAGVALGAAWGYAWGNCNWGHGSCDIDINQNTNINRNIDRSKYQNNINNRSQAGTTGRGSGSGKGTWQHDASHRKGAAYRDQATAQKYQGNKSKMDASSREQFSGRQSPQQPSAGNRQAQTRGGSNSRQTGMSSGAFEGVNRGSDVKRDAARGQSSRQSSPSASQRSSSSRSSGAASRSGGSSRSSGGASRSSGGSRGGGGRGGGGGGRR